MPKTKPTAPNQPAPASAPPPNPDLKAEIDLLREFIQRVGAMAEDVDELNTAARLLVALGKASDSLGGLVRTQQQIASTNGGKISIEIAIAQAIADVAKELKL